MAASIVGRLLAIGAFWSDRFVASGQRVGAHALAIGGIGPSCCWSRGDRLSCYWAPKFRLGWDSMMIWEAKAYLAWRNGGVIPSDIYSDEDRIFFNHFIHSTGHTCRPGFWMDGCAPNQAADLVYFGWVSCLRRAAAFTGVMQRVGGPRFLGLLGGPMLFAVPYLFSGLWGLLSGYADFPLAVVMLWRWGSRFGGSRRIPWLRSVPS